MPKSKFSVGQLVVLSHAGTIWTVKSTRFDGEEYFVTAVREGQDSSGVYHKQQIEYYESRFETI